MATETDSLTITNVTLDDFDQLADVARGWDFDLRQLDRGRFRADVLQARGTGFHLAAARFGRHVEQQGAPPRHLRTFAVPLNPTMRMRWRGQEVTGRQVLAFPLGGELHAVSRPDFDVCTFAVDNELLERAGQALGLAVPWRELNRTEVFDFEPAHMAALRGALARICAQLTRPEPGPLGAALHRELERETPKLLVRGLTSADPVDARTASPARAGAVERATVYMAHHAANAVTIRDVCRDAGVCERMLEYAFKEHYGVSPKAYLQAFRLNSVRRELRVAVPADMKVADAANLWGFWHMGQFAADYRKQFGEKPSETLRR